MVPRIDIYKSVLVTINTEFGTVFISIGDYKYCTKFFMSHYISHLHSPSLFHHISQLLSFHFISALFHFYRISLKIHFPFHRFCLFVICNLIFCIHHKQVSILFHIVYVHSGKIFCNISSSSCKSSANGQPLHPVLSRLYGFL